MIRILATICSIVTTDDCRTLTVTTSDMADLSMSACMVGEPSIAKWLLENHPGYRLAGWTCEMGERARRTQT